MSSLFGNLGSATKPAGTSGTPSLFGNTTSSNPAQASTGGTGLFANTTTTPAPVAGTATQSQPTTQSTKPATTGGLFSQSGGQTTTTTTTTTTGGLFSQTGGQAPATGGLFSQSAAQPSTTQKSVQPSQTSSVFPSTTGLGGGLRGPQVQPAKDEPPVYTSTFEKYLKACQISNPFLFDLIIDPKPALAPEDFKKLLADKTIQDKFSQALAFYKPKSQGSESAFKEMTDGKLKWPGKLPVSTKAQEIIKRVSEKLDLDAYQTFSLFELYFEFNKPLLDKITNWQPQSSANPELEAALHQLEKTIVAQYYKERISLLECIYQVIVLATSQGPLKYKESIEKLVNDVIKGKPAFSKGLWASYTKISESNAANLSPLFNELQDREEWALQNLKEEFYLLKILYILYYELEECPPDFFYTMLDYFNKQSFVGSFHKHARQVTIQYIQVQKDDYADMLADISVLTLLNCMNLNNFELEILLEDDEEQQSINLSKNPLLLLTKKGKDISNFFADKTDNKVLAPLIIAWKRLIKWYIHKVKDAGIKNTLKSIDIIKEDPEDYLSFMLEIKNRALFETSNRIALCFYRNTMKSWVCLLAQGFEVESIFSYEKLVDICCECLKERQNLDRFWTYEFRYKTSIAVLLFELLKMFPFREAKLIKFVSTLLGDKRQSYVTNIMRLFKNLESYACRSSEILPDDHNYIRPHPDERGSLICLKDINIGTIIIPENTKGRVIFESGKDIRIYEFYCPYNFWSVLYRRWIHLLQQIARENKVEFIGADLKLIKLVCKLIIFDNNIIDSLEEHFIFERSDKKLGESIPIPLLLLNTLFYFQNLPQIPQKIISLVFKALANIQAHPIHSTTLATIIQLFPRTITSVQGYETSFRGATSRSILGATTIGGLRSPEFGPHPIFDVFDSIKRIDRTLETPEKNYDTYLSMLKFAYEVILSNEFIFDQYPTENYIKNLYGRNMANINRYIQKGVNLITLAQERDDSEDLRDLHSFLKAKKNQSLIYSSFTDDLFTFVFKSVMDNYDNMLFLPNLMDKKWKMGSYLFKITNLLLQRFLVSLERVQIIYENSTENSLLVHIINYLNNSRITDLILKTLEVVISTDFIKNNKYGESFNPLGIENKLWLNYILSQTTSDKQAKRLREMIANCLSCLETILQLVEIYTENRSVTEDSTSLLHQSYVSKLNVVDTFEKLLTKKELLHFYVHNDMTQSAKINIIMALFSYINFDVNKGLNPHPQLDPRIEKFLSNPTLLRNSIVSEEEAGEIELLLANLDPALTQNLILKSQFKSNQQVNAVSTIALRVLTKLALIWEDQVSQRKPSLYEYLTMISHPDVQFTSNNIIRTTIRELLCIFVNYESQFEDACSLLEMMTVCLHSQKNFVDLFLKNTANYSLYQQDSFLSFVKTFFNSNVESYKPLLTKLIIFLSEVFQRESRYSSFVQAIRKDKNLIRSIFATVFKTLTPNYSLAYRMSDYCNLNSQDLKASDIKELTFQLEKLMVETLATQECSNLFAIVIAVRFLMQELISLGGKSKEEGENISLCTKEFFSGFFMMWFDRFKQKGITKLIDQRSFQEFLEDLSDPNNRVQGETCLEEPAMGVTNRSIRNTKSMLLERDRDTSYISNLSGKIQEFKGAISLSEFKKYQRRKKRQQIKNMEVEKEGDDQKDKFDSILIKSIYKILDINLYGYGKNFLYDTQEIFFAMKISNYKKDFIYRSILFLTKQNLLNSLLTLEHKYFESMITLFKFISTLGLKGQAFSSTYYQFAHISPELYNTSLEDVFDGPKEKSLANPNNNITFHLGFPDFFTKVNSSDALDKKVSSSAIFLDKVIRLTWDSFRQDANDFEINNPSIKALEQKANFLAFAFNTLFYLLKVSKSILSTESDSKAKQTISSDRMEREKEKKIPLVLEAAGLREILRDIYEEMNSVIWNKIREARNELEVNISSFVILELAFLQCMNEVSSYVKLDPKAIKFYVESLESCIQEKIPYLSLVISCFELLYKLNAGEFLEYFVYSQGRLLKYLTAKLNDDTSFEIETIFIIKFFVELAKEVNGALYLKENNIIWELCSNKKLKDSHLSPDYQNGQRNPYQVYWCWVLILMRQLVETLHQEPGFMNLAISFLKEFSPRINYILLQPHQVLRRDAAEANKRESTKFTMSFFEEFELTAALLFEYFQHAEEWIIINRSLFELILYNITNHALRAFRSSNVVVDSSISCTAFEKVFEQISAVDKKATDSSKQIQKEPIPTSPMKSRMSFRIDPVQKDANFSSFDSYNPNIFAYKLEVSLLNTLGYLLYSIKNGLQYSELYNYFDEFDMARTDRKRVLVKYETSYWDNFALTLDDVHNYLYCNLHKWMSQSSTIDKAAKKYDYLNNSVNSTIQNYGLNTNFQSHSFADLRHLMKTNMSLTLYNMTLHFSMFKEFKSSETVFVEGTIAGNKERLMGIIDKCAALLTNKNVFSNTSIGGENGESKAVPDVSDLLGTLRECLK